MTVRGWELPHFNQRYFYITKKEINKQKSKFDHKSLNFS